MSRRGDAQVADANAYAMLTTVQAGVDEAFWLFGADALATAASNLATTSGTPWAAYQGAEMAEYEMWVIAAAPAQEQERIASATAQANAEIAWADAQKFMAIALAGAEQVWTTALADAQLALAQAQGALVAAMGSSFGYSPTMPTLDSVPGLDSYVIPAAGEARYYVNVTFASSSYWGWGSGGGFLAVDSDVGAATWAGAGTWVGAATMAGRGGLGGYYGYGDWDPSNRSANCLWHGVVGHPDLAEPRGSSEERTRVGRQAHRQGSGWRQLVTTSLEPIAVRTIHRHQHSRMLLPRSTSAAPELGTVRVPNSSS